MLTESDKSNEGPGNDYANIIARSKTSKSRQPGGNQMPHLRLADHGGCEP